MIIERVGTHHRVFKDYSLEGTTLTIAGIPVDLAAEQQDQEVSIVFSQHEGSIRRGMLPCMRQR